MAVPPPRVPDLDLDLDPDSDAQLLRAAGRGDANALARIIRLHHEAMTRAALIVVLDVAAAAEAVTAAWPVAAHDIRGGARPRGLEAWLSSLAVAEARSLAGQETTVPRDATATPGGLARHDEPDLRRDPALVATLAAMTPSERACLALRHVVGLDPAHVPAPRGPVRRSRPPLERLEDAVAATPPPFAPAALGAGPDGHDPHADPGTRLRALVEVPVRPVHADQAARRAFAELELERGRRVSVAVCAVVGFLVAAAPHLVPLVYGR